MCTNYCDHCPISSRGACESAPIVSPDLSLHWLVARPVVTHHYCKSRFYQKNSYLTFIITSQWIIFILTGISLFTKVKWLLKMMLEWTYHSPARNPNHLHVHQDLDFVWLRFGQISNHLTVIIDIFNINGILLVGRKWWAMIFKNSQLWRTLLTLDRGTWSWISSVLWLYR